MSSSPNTSDPTFRKCWNRNACDDCLSSIDPTCGWCPFTQTCVPANFITPLHSSPCPSRSERWEMRTAPLGCQVSMITLAGMLAGAAGALVIVLLVASAFWAWRRRRRHDAEEGDRLLRGVGREGLGRRVSFWAYNTFLPDNSGGGGSGGTDAAAAAAGGYGTISGAGGTGAGDGYGSDEGRGGGGGGVIGRVDSMESFGGGGLDDGLEERRRRVLERG